MGLMEKIAGLVTQAPGPASTSVPSIPPAGGRPGTGAEYMRGGRSMTYQNWRPALRTSRQDVGSAWDTATARAIDTIQNSGWISGMMDQAVANVVGTGLRLHATPDHEALGISADEGSKLGRLFERRFNAWASDPNECDVEGRRTFGQMQAAAYRSWYPTGEIWAEYPWRKRPGGEFGTKVRLIPAQRIMRKTSPMERLVQGVYLDADDRATGYHTFKEGQFGIRTEYRVPARDRHGRPRVTHIFDGMPSTVRGITPMIGALQVAKQFDQLSDATLMSWLIQTVFAAAVTSDEPTEEIMQGLLSPQEQAKAAADNMSNFDAWFAAQSGWYDGAPLDVGINGRIAHMFPGQKFEFLSPANQAADYRDLTIVLLREMSRCFGLTYESGTGDYEGATYSSVRMATGEIFQITLYRRTNIVKPFCRPAYAAVIEEDIASGRMKVPGGYGGFLKNKAAFLRDDWRGTPQPRADEYKTAKTHETYRAMGLMTDEMIAQDLGTNVEALYDGRQREQEMRKARGLPDLETQQPETVDFDKKKKGDDE